MRNAMAVTALALGLARAPHKPPSRKAAAAAVVVRLTAARHPRAVSPRPLSKVRVQPRARRTDPIRCRLQACQKTA